jgi:hypothetical protein
LNAKPFNFQWVVPKGFCHLIVQTAAGGLYVGPATGSPLGTIVGTLEGGDAGRVFQIAGNDIPPDPVIVPAGIVRQ